MEWKVLELLLNQNCNYNKHIYMAFFKNIKRSFGFADSEEEYDYEDGIDATVKRRESVKPSNISDEPVVSYANRAPYHASNTSYVDESAEDKLKKMQMKIFEGVVDLFNKSLPEGYYYF